MSGHAGEMMEPALCEVCYAIVDAKYVDKHYEWHKMLRTSIKLGF